MAEITHHITGSVENLKGTDQVSRPINATYLNGEASTYYASLDDIKMGDYSGYLYKDSDSVYHIKFKAGSYIIDEPTITMSDGTTKENTILTQGNIAKTGLFVPMTGTIDTPMTGGIWMKGSFDITTGSSGMTAGNTGSSSAKTKYADNYWGEKGLAYHYYGTDSTYGTTTGSGDSSFGIVYKPSTASGYYTGNDASLSGGLTIYWYQSAYNYNNYDDTKMTYVNISYDGNLTYRNQGTQTSVNIANIQTKLVSGTSIKTINSTSLLGSGDIAITSAPTWASKSTGIMLYSGYYVTNMFAKKGSFSSLTLSAGSDTYTDVTITGGSTGSGTWHAVVSVSGSDTAASYSTYFTVTCAVTSATKIRVYIHALKAISSKTIYFELVAFKYY
jgi:hypothetical protein